MGSALLRVGTLSAVLLCLTVLSLDGRAAETVNESNAVARTNGRMAFSYGYAESHRTNGRDQRHAKGWRYGGGVTTPIGTSFGLRADLNGGQRSTDDELFGRTETSDVDFETALFWRNPERASVSFNYDYTYNSVQSLGRSAVLPNSTRRHWIGTELEYYWRCTDLLGAMRYSPGVTRGEGVLQSLDPDVYALWVSAGPRAYLGESLALAGRFRWDQFEYSAFVGISGISNTYAGVFSIEYLPQKLSRGWLLFGLNSTVGRTNETIGVNTNFSIRSFRDQYSVGGTVTILFPAQESIRRYFRAYR